MTPQPPNASRHPVWIIAAKELRECIRDGRFRLLAASILALLIAGLATGWHETQATQQSIASAQASEQATWLGQGPRNPHSAAHFGHYAFKPKPALSALDRGVNAYLGTAVWLEAHWQDPFALRPAEDRTAVQRFGELTVAFTLQVLAPLLIVFLGFSTFAGERERGTLLQLMSLGLEPRHLALGKALGLGTALALVMVPAVLLACAVGLGFGSESLDGSVGKAALMAASYGLYFVLLLGLVLTISARVQRARNALVILLGFWMVSTVLVPRLVADLAEGAYPIPTPRAFFAAIAEDEAQGMEGQGTRQERRQALTDSTLEEYDVESLEQLPINFAGLSLQASEEHSNLVYDKHYGNLWRHYSGQERLHQWGAMLSPTLALRSLSMALAGTDVAHHRHFADAAEQHRRVLVKFLNDDMTHHAGEASFTYMADETLWRTTPEFSYQPPNLGEALAGQAPALGWLVVWFGASMALATRAVTGLQVLSGERT